MPSIRIEFISLTRGVLQDGRPDAVIGEQVGNASTPLSPGSVVAPASPGGPLFVRATAIGGPVILSVAAAASQTVGLRLATEVPEVLRVEPGASVSFVDAAS